ncbi:Polyol transporter 5 [Vanrija pseudolonga]|uniref:Polyol transporter 5 n=1 Tax=Vanrija pseudolonga TaxID=143232 RepID=A0AAF0YEC8_9TREE|nr:Polyol transporter 5 [Vanrija pseudolonga]
MSTDPYNDIKPDPHAAVRTHRVDNVIDIENPLQRLPAAQVAADARAFAEAHDLGDHAEDFVKGALVARSPDELDTIPELSDADRAALAFEKDHKWRCTGQLYFAALICALGAATEGWDIVGSNGANLSFPVEFGIARPRPEPGASRDEWIVGLINSAPYLAAAMVGVWVSDPLNNWLGRRGLIFVTGLGLIATPLGMAFTRSWQQLLAVRLLMGIPYGAKAATVSVYAAEISPTAIRGAITIGWQLWVTFGIFIGMAANVIVKDVPRIAWRLQLGSAFIPSVPLVFLVWLAPESPRWLMKKNRYPAAFAAFYRLRKTPLAAARDMYYSHVLYEEEVALAKGTTYWSRLTDLFTVPRIRRASLGAFTTMIGQQLCGINVISFYSSTVFREGGYTNDQALYASLGFGALNFAFCIPALFLVDTFGRRSLLLSTFPFMTLFLLLTGLAFLLPDSQASTRTSLVAAFIYIYTVFYSVGEGPIAFLYPAEVFPTVHREQGMAWGVWANNFFASLLGLTFPSLLRGLTPVGAFCLYAGLNTLALSWVWCFVPETKGLTLEEIDQVFSVPTRHFIHYETTQWLPWWFRRYVLFDRKAHLVPLLDWETDRQAKAARRVAA